jgi:hypothetical protein
VTTISDDSIARVCAETRQPGSPGDPAEARARRFWVWASAGWLTSVCVTVVVAAGDAIPVAIGGMALAAVGNAMAVPEPGTSAPDGPEVRP